MEPGTGQIFEVDPISVEIDDCARFAVDEYNKKEKAVLQFQKVVKAEKQIVAGAMYYITVEVTDGGVKKVYAAKVFVNLTDIKDLLEFKPIGDAPSSASA